MSWPERFRFYFGPGAPAGGVIAEPIQSTGAIWFNADLAAVAGETPQARASAPATGAAVFTVEIARADAPNVWDVVGSATYAPAAVSATIVSVGHAAPSLAAGDTIVARSPATPDATLAGVAIVLVGARG